ncbi:MAG: bifunctional UDP-N-acetylglucosamine diphosphorylase/glucosamine-1-phosphate N-acetyltransferase GlmU, partial [Paracoccus sp. (in: a-proteobacteria)]
LYGDTPFIGQDTLAALASHPADLVVLGFEAEEPGRYGRLVVTSRGLERIVEYKDADAATRDIALCNSGVMALDAGLLRQLIVRLTNDNAAGEYYLTDLPELARAEGRRADVVTCDEEETLGINTRAELARAESLFQATARARALEDGVTLTDPGSTWFALDTVLGRDAIIGP